MRPRVGVDPAARALLDVVVSDGLRGLEGRGDLLLGRLGQEGHSRVGVGRRRGVVHPYARVAVGLQLQAHRVRGGACARAVGAVHGAEQVLDVVAELVGHDVLLGQGRVLGADGALHVGEEAHVQVDSRVPRAVERADRRRGGAAGRAHRRAVPQAEAGFGVGGGGLRGQLLAPHGVQRLGRRRHAALGILIGGIAIGGGAVAAHGHVDRRARRRGGARAAAQQPGQVDAGEVADEEHG